MYPEILAADISTNRIRKKKMEIAFSSVGITVVLGATAYDAHGYIYKKGTNAKLALHLRTYPSHLRSIHEKFDSNRNVLMSSTRTECRAFEPRTIIQTKA